MKSMETKNACLFFGYFKLFQISDSNYLIFMIAPFGHSPLNDKAKSGSDIREDPLIQSFVNFFLQSTLSGDKSEK